MPKHNPKQHFFRLGGTAPSVATLIPGGRGEIEFRTWGKGLGAMCVTALGVCVAVALRASSTVGAHTGTRWWYIRSYVAMGVDTPLPGNPHLPILPALGTAPTLCCGHLCVACPCPWARGDLIPYQAKCSCSHGLWPVSLALLSWLPPGAPFLHPPIPPTTLCDIWAQVRDDKVCTSGCFCPRTDSGFG